MYRNLLNWLTILLVLPSCSGTSPTISVVCEENNVGNAIIKWETAPILKGQVKVYASTSPDFIPEENPVATINIAKGKKTIVTNDPSQRYYYLMVFNNRYRVRVAARNVNIPAFRTSVTWEDTSLQKQAKIPAGECCTVLHRLTAFHSAPAGN